MDAGYIFQKKTYDGPVHLLELEAGAAGSLHRVGAVMVWLRREDESRHFNSYISSSLPSHHFAVNVCLTEQAAQRGGNKCTSPSTPPFIKNVILKQMGGGGCKHAYAQCFCSDSKTTGTGFTSGFTSGGSLKPLNSVRYVSRG